MTTEAIPALTGTPFGAVLRRIEALAAGFRWAREVKRLCDRAEARGRRLDADTLRQLMADADRRLARRPGYPGDDPA